MDPGGLLAVLHPSACRHISRISASIFTWVLFACTSVSKFSSLFFFFFFLAVLGLHCGTRAFL